MPASGGNGPTKEELGSDDVVAVVVTYHPSRTSSSLIHVLSDQCGHVVVVDNGSNDSELADLRSACRQSCSTLVELGRNTGIAAAQNIGIARARDRGARLLLLSDDDSRPPADMVVRLLEGMQVVGAHSRVAAVGPLVGEEKPGGDQLVYVARRWGPRRASPEELRQPALEVPFLIASGCLIDLEALDVIGPMDVELFIDHVDLQWGLRARRAGYSLYVVTDAHMAHNLGDETTHIRGRTQPVHVHAPLRNYYLARNTVTLVKGNLMPICWRIGYVVWLAKYSAFNVLLADRRRERVGLLLHGILDGLRGRGGPFRRARCRP